MAFKFENADPSNDAFRMEQWPFYWLARISRGYAYGMDAALKRVGMDIARWRVLMMLQQTGSSSITELAHHGVLKLSTMTKTVQRLEADGLVCTTTRATDARVTEVSLTYAGKTGVESVRKQAGRIYNQAFEGFSATEIAKLNEVLRRLNANLDKA